MWYILFENPRTTAKYLKLYARVCVCLENGVAHHFKKVSELS